MFGHVVSAAADSCCTRSADLRDGVPFEMTIERERERDCTLFKVRQLLPQLDFGQCKKKQPNNSKKKKKKSGKGRRLPIASPGSYEFVSRHTSSRRLKSLHPRRLNEALGGGLAHLQCSTKS